MNIRRETYTAPSLKGEADDLIWQRQFQLAGDVLEKNMFASLERGDIDEYRRFALKKASLPLYELAIDGQDDGRIGRALEVQNDISTLLEAALADYSEGYVYTNHTLGHISELTLALLCAHDLHCHNPMSVLLPATANDEGDGFLATDYYLAAIADKGDGFYPIQLKTRPTEESHARYKAPINVVGMNELDKSYSGKPHHNLSLANTLVRTVAGKADKYDHATIERATLQFYRKISTSSSDGLVSHPVKQEWKQPARTTLTRFYLPLTAALAAPGKK